MDLKQLRAFITVAETGNVTRASSLLNLVQPAVSRQLRMLEEDLGTELFDRSRHGMQLTPSGKTMLEYAHRILNDVARARAEIQPNSLSSCRPHRKVCAPSSNTPPPRLASHCRCSPKPTL